MSCLLGLILAALARLGAESLMSSAPHPIDRAGPRLWAPQKQGPLPAPQLPPLSERVQSLREVPGETESQTADDRERAKEGEVGEMESELGRDWQGGREGGTDPGKTKLARPRVVEAVMERLSQRPKEMDGD